MTRRGLLLGAAAVAVALLAIEGGLRLLRPRVAALRPLLYHSGVDSLADRAATLEELLETSILGFAPGTLAAGFVTNSRGFRTPEYDVEKAPGTYRVVVLGDSFAFSSGGVPYEDHWTTLLERELAARRDGPVEVINLGVPAVGTRFERRLWQLEGSRLDADLALLAFTVSTDFTDSLAWTARESVVDRLARRSFVVRLLRNVARARERRAGDAEPAEARPVPDGVFGVPLAEVDPTYAYRYDPDRPRFTAEGFLRTLATSLAIHDPEQADFTERAFSEAGTTLLGLRDDVVAAGAGFAVAVIPTPFQTDDAVWRDLAAFVGRDPDALDRDRPQRFLAMLFEDEGIVAVDLLPPLRAATRAGARPYGVRNAHWTGVGCALAADAIASALARPR